MKHSKTFPSGLPEIIFTFLFILIPFTSNCQEKIGFGLHFDPVISWFSSDIKEVRSEGARPGFNFGLTFNKYFTPNYSFSIGLSLVNAGGRLISSDTTVMDFTNFKYKLTKVLPNESVVYKINYLAFPVGLKLQTNQIGYFTVFADVGLAPKIVIGGNVDIPSLDISDERAMKELRMFNFSYYITAGVEYSLGGSTALVFGLGFDNNFLDITTDNGIQPSDKVSHKLLNFRLGVNF